jgi:hypothetical protein
MIRVMSYWKTYCSDGKGGLCQVARSGSLQCVEMVTAASWLAGDPLPVIGNAEDFWNLYANRMGWERLPSPSSFPGVPFLAPLPGDLMVWKGGGFFQAGKWYEFGHLAIVLSYRPPSGDHNGTIEVAQANAPGNRYANPNIPGNTYTMLVHPNGSIATWGPTADTGGYQVLGFLRHLSVLQLPKRLGNSAAARTLPHGLTFMMPYVREAWNDALAVKFPPGYFVRQITMESHFNPRAISATGAIGIAQFLPATARGLPNPFGQGRLNPWDPHQSLLAAARLLAAKARQYGGDDVKALAAFHAGDHVVQAAIQVAATVRLPMLWSTYLPEEPRSYLDTLLGS